MNLEEKLSKLTRKTGMILMVSSMFVLFATKAFATAGGSAVPFLVISPDARASGMGEVGTAIADDINAVYWNPAGLGFKSYINPDAEYEEDLIPYRQVALSYSKWLPQFNADLFYAYGAIGQYFDKIGGTLALNFVFMNLGEFTRTYENGSQGGKFLSNEFAIGLSYGGKLTKDVAWGVQLKYIQSNLAPASSFSNGDAGIGRSGGFDLGFLWRPSNLNFGGGFDFSNKLSLGINLQNVGPKVTYREESDPLPTTLRLGSAYEVYTDEYNDLKVSCDVSKLLVKRDSLGSDPVPKSFVTAWQNGGLQLSAGFEYWYKVNNAPLFALRGGYFTEPASIGDRRYYNFGAGIKYDIFNLNFSFINTIESNHPLANTMRFSLLIDWN